VHLDNRLEIANPSPVPPLGLGDRMSACWNSWNSFFWSASEMPGPVSQNGEAVMAVVGGSLDRYPAPVCEF